MWKVLRLDLTSDAKRSPGTRVWYELRAEGVNTETGLPFSWAVPCLCDPRYDISSADVTLAAALRPLSHACSRSR